MARRRRRSPALRATAPSAPPPEGRAATSSSPGTGLDRRSAAVRGRTLRQILRANLLTRFNALLAALLVVVAFVGPVQDALFGLVLVINTVVAVAQELRAKRAVDRMALLSAPVAHVVGGRGEVLDCPPERLAREDVVQLSPGDELVADAVVLESCGLQLDESLLTGEAQPIPRRPGEELLSGSFVVAGTGRARVTRVGGEAYAQRLELDARRYRAPYSELQGATNTVLRAIGWVMLPLSAALAASQLLVSHSPRAEALRGTVAGVGAIVPGGLVLLTTLAFAL